MPQSSIFGAHASHPFIQQPEFVNENGFLQDFGAKNDFHVRNLKRKDSTHGFDAGNFEIENFGFGPTMQKRAKVSLSGETGNETHQDESKMASATIIPESNNQMVCNSMVTHMTTSFLQETQEKQVEDQSYEMDVSEGMEIECENNVPQSADNQALVEMATDSYKPAETQDQIPRKAHFYMYRCKPQYCIFH